MKQHMIFSELCDLDESVVVGTYSIIGLQGRDRDKIVRVGKNVAIGNGVKIYTDVEIGEDTLIKDDVFIASDNRIGANCKIGPKTVLEFGNRIGDNCRIHSLCFLERVIVGNGVFIGPGVIFTDDYHPPCPNYAECVPKTIIENNVSFGANVTVCPGVTVGEGSFVYAGAVITKDVEKFSVIAGVPGKRIGDVREIACKSGNYSSAFRR